MNTFWTTSQRRWYRHKLVVREHLAVVVNAWGGQAPPPISFRDDALRRPRLRHVEGLPAGGQQHVHFDPEALPELVLWWRYTTAEITSSSNQSSKIIWSWAVRIHPLVSPPGVTDCVQLRWFCWHHCGFFWVQILRLADAFIQMDLQLMVWKNKS